MGPTTSQKRFVALVVIGVVVGVASWGIRAMMRASRPDPAPIASEMPYGAIPGPGGSTGALPTDEELLRRPGGGASPSPWICALATIGMLLAGAGLWVYRRLSFHLWAGRRDSDDSEAAMRAELVRQETMLATKRAREARSTPRDVDR